MVLVSSLHFNCLVKRWYLPWRGHDHGNIFRERDIPQLGGVCPTQPRRVSLLVVITVFLALCFVSESRHGGVDDAAGDV